MLGGLVGLFAAIVFLYGVIALISGRYKMRRSDPLIRGKKARLAGLICLLNIPALFFIMMILEALNQLSDILWLVGMLVFSILSLYFSRKYAFSADSAE